MDDKQKVKNNVESNKKTATDNQWISTGIARVTDESVRKDGPGGEDGNNSN